MTAAVTENATAKPQSDCHTAHVWVDSRCRIAESPRWDERRGGELLWVDLDDGVLWRWSADRGAVHAALGRATGVAAPRRGGGLVTAGPGGFTWMDDCGTTGRTVDLPEDWSVMRMNDGACDPAGRLVCGSTPWEAGRRTGTLYQLSGDGSVRVLLTGLGMSNGVAWSPDGMSMHHVDSLAYTVSTYDYSPQTGELGERRAMFRIDPSVGMPDGLAVDEDGLLWVAIWGGHRVTRYTADGTRLADVAVPARYVTSCIFGGLDRGDLYITTARWDLDDSALAGEPAAGGVFRCRVGVRGMAPALFDG